MVAVVCCILLFVIVVLVLMYGWLYWLLEFALVGGLVVLLFSVIWACLFDLAFAGFCLVSIVAFGFGLFDIWFFCDVLFRLYFDGF